MLQLRVAVFPFPGQLGLAGRALGNEGQLCMHAAAMHAFFPWNLLLAALTCILLCWLLRGRAVLFVWLALPLPLPAHGAF